MNSQNRYDTMTLDEVKQYFLQHRDDQQAFYAYMDKLQASGRAIVIDPTNPQSEADAIAQMQQRLGMVEH
jgi:hypothetical protein